MRNSNNNLGSAHSDEEEWEFLSDEDETSSLLLREEQEQEEEEYHIQEIDDEEDEEEEEQEQEHSDDVEIVDKTDSVKSIHDDEFESQHSNDNEKDKDILLDVLEPPPPSVSDELKTEEEEEVKKGMVADGKTQTFEEEDQIPPLAIEQEEEEDTTIPPFTTTSTNKNHDFEVNDDDDCMPGLYILKDMGFSKEESKVALAACGGNVEHAVCVLLGEQQEWNNTNTNSNNHPFYHQDGVLPSRVASSLRHRARSVKHTVEKEAGRVYDDVKMVCNKHDLSGKAKMAGHQVKLSARSVGREVKTFNERFHITDALATVGVAAAVTAVAMGNPRAATAAVAMAGSAFVAGESMKYSNERRGNGNNNNDGASSSLYD